MSTYGFDDSKSKKPVYPASEVYTKTEVYNKTETYTKTEVYNKIEADEKFLTQAAGAPKNHASTSSQYGLGTSSNYGHVKLTTSTSAPSGSQDGIALAGSMGYTLKKYTDDSIAAYTGGQLPVGAFIMTATQSLRYPGYGTWVYKTWQDVPMHDGSSTTIRLYIYQRTA